MGYAPGFVAQGRNGVSVAAERNGISVSTLPDRRSRRAAMCVVATSAAVLVLVSCVTPALAQQVPAPGAPIRVVTKEFEPLVIRDGDKFSGFSIDLLKEIASRLNLRYDIHAVGTVDSLVKEVADGKADIGVAGISITSQRQRLVDFSHPIYNSGLQILVRASAGSSGLGRTFSVLFSRPVLGLLGILLLLMVLMAHVIWLLEGRRSESDFPRSYGKGINDGVWWSAVTMTTVGYGDKTPRSVAGRVAGIAWMFVAIILFANFTATVASSLTVQGLQGSINGPGDLPGKRVATVQGTSSVDYLSKLSSTLVQTPTIKDAYELLDRGEVDAVVFDAPVLLYHAASAGRGNVEVVGPVFARQDYGIALRPGSRLRQDINTTILTIMEDGRYAELQTKWFGPQA